jgi:hypothetical protein
METQSKAEEYRRVCLIATSKIPVSEESLVFNLFTCRKELAKVFLKSQSDINQEMLLEEIKYTEDKIKEYLYL